MVANDRVSYAYEEVQGELERQLSKTGLRQALPSAAHQLSVLLRREAAHWTKGWIR
jgi:hypothetical protein